MSDAVGIPSGLARARKNLAQIDRLARADEMGCTRCR